MLVEAIEKCVHFFYIIPFFFHIEAIIVDSASSNVFVCVRVFVFLCMCAFVYYQPCVSCCCEHFPLGFPVREQGWYIVLMSVSLPKLTWALFAFNYSLFLTLQITQHALQLVKFKCVDSVLYFFYLYCMMLWGHDVSTLVDSYSSAPYRGLKYIKIWNLEVVR